MGSVSRLSAMPLWAQVAADLRVRLGSGEFVDRFPTDKALAERYGVSRHTVRTAVRELQSAGIVERARGVGSFVTPGLTEEPLRERYTLTRTVPDSDVVAHNEVRLCESALPPDDAREHLGLATGARAVHVERLRVYGDEPMALHSSWLPIDVARPLLSVDLREGSFYSRLAEHCDVRVTSGWERVNVVVPNKEQRQLLRAPSKVAAFHSERLAFSGPEPIEFRVSLLRGDRYRLVAEWSPDDAPWSRP